MDSQQNVWSNDKRKYLGVGSFYLINSKNLQIGISIGMFSVINSEELQIGKF